MPNYNQINLIGRLTNKPDIRNVDIVKDEKMTILETSKFSIAVNNYYNDEVLFVNCNCFNKIANATKFLKKGSNVFISGELKSCSWKNDLGEKRKDFFVTVKNIQFLDKKDTK